MNTADRNGAITVVLLGRDSLLLAGLRSVLEAEPDICVVADASCALHGARLMQQLVPHVLLVECTLLQQPELLERAAAAGTHIVALTAADREWTPPEGVGGYLSKNSTAALVVLSVRAFGRGGFVLDPSVLSRMARRPG